MDSPINSGMNAGFQNNNNKQDTLLAQEDAEANLNASNEGKGRNPYYFTFFNEKNEQS